MNVKINGVTHGMRSPGVPQVRVKQVRCGTLWVQEMLSDWPWPIGTMTDDPVDCMQCLARPPSEPGP
jgi:hypothetical protein